MHGLCFYIMFGLLLLNRVELLKLLEVIVPPFLKKGESASLECRYNLESDKLYSVSWYKDNEHIYRYSHKNMAKQVFSTPGVHVDLKKSSDQVLHIQRVSLNSTGNYACEVNTDSAPFKSIKGEAYVEVVELPSHDPRITGNDSVFVDGDFLELNCTSDFSHPAAQLVWYINDAQVDSHSEIKYVTNHSLYSTQSSLHIQSFPQQSKDGKVEVKCQSMVFASLPTKNKYFVDKRVTRFLVKGNSVPSKSSIMLLIVPLAVFIV